MGRVDDWRYCPRCSANLTPAGERVACPKCGFVAHSNSEPTACALCLDDGGRILLVRRARDPDKGKWDLPGGFLEEAEHPLETLRRELVEETGLEIEPLEFVGAWMDRYGDGEDAPTTLNLYWTARIVAGDPRPADDVDELAWFSPDQLPPDDQLAFRNVAQALRFWRERT